MFEQSPSFPRCPRCLKHAVALSDSNARDAAVWLFRCEDCGHVWELLRDETLVPSAMFDALQQLIDAIDRRMPQRAREAEPVIAQDAADLRERAVLLMRAITTASAAPPRL